MSDVIVDVSELTATLRRMSERSQNSSGMNQELANILELHVDDKFRDQGPGWAPMRELTLRLRRGSTGKLLQDTGHLAQISSDYGPDFAEVFTNVEYAKYHLKGPRQLVPLYHKTGVWHLPVRDFFDIDIPGALSEMSEVVVAEYARY